MSALVLIIVVVFVVFLLILITAATPLENKPQPTSVPVVPTHHQRFLDKVFDGLGIPDYLLPAFSSYALVIYQRLEQKSPNDTIFNEENTMETARWYVNKWFNEMPKIPRGSPDSPFTMKLLEHLYPQFCREPTIIPVDLPLPLRYRGTWIVAPPDSGKTSLLNAMINQHLPEVAEGKANLFLMDSKSSPSEALIDYWRTVDFEAIDRRFKGKMHVIDPNDDIAINLFDLADADPLLDLFDYIFANLLSDMKLSGHQTLMLTKCILAVKANPQPSIWKIRDLLTNGWRDYERGIRRLDQDHQDYFFKPINDPNSRRPTTLFDRSDTRSAVQTRVEALLSRVTLLRPTLRSTQTRLNLQKMIDEGGHIFMVSCKTAQLGNPGSEFLQRFWTMLILHAARTRETQKPLYCFMDEAHRGIARDTRVSDTLDECRSARIALCMAHQRRGQITDSSVMEALEGCGIRFERERHKPTGQFNAYIDGIPHEPIPLTVKLVRPSDYPQLSKSRQAQLKAELRARFSVTSTKPPAGFAEPEYEQPAYTQPRPHTQRKPHGPTIDDADWEDITEDEPPTRRRLPPPPATSTDFEL